MNKKTIENLSKQGEKALIIGIGGGGDIVGSIPTAKYIERLGLETIIGGLTWERSVNDPKPGPRKISELKNLNPLNKTTALANPQTKTEEDVKITEASVSEILGEETFLLDLNYGVKGAVEGLNKAVEELNIDFIVGVDVGGDVLGSGKEEGLRSMLADSMVLSTLHNLEIPSVLGVLGMGADGELVLDQLMENSAEIASVGGFLGARGIDQEDLKILREAVRNTKTESSALALRAAEGEYGEVGIRDGERKVEVSLITAITFYFDPELLVKKINNVAIKLSRTETIEEAQQIMDKEGIPTELEYEKITNGKTKRGK